MMKTKLLLCSLLTASILVSMGTAGASTINYVLTTTPGAPTPLTISFSLPSQPGSNLPCDFYHSCFSVTPVDFSVNGTPYTGGIVDFYDSSPGPDGGLVLQYADASILVNLGGAVLSPGVYQTLYSGTLSDPTLLSFSNLPLYGYSNFGPQIDENFILNASPNATPEPSSLLLLGSGLVGFAGMLRRKIGLRV